MGLVAAINGYPFCVKTGTVTPIFLLHFSNILNIITKRTKF